MAVVFFCKHKPEPRKVSIDIWMIPREYPSETNAANAQNSKLVQYQVEGMYGARQWSLVALLVLERSKSMIPALSSSQITRRCRCRKSLGKLCKTGKVSCEVTATFSLPYFPVSIIRYSLRCLFQRSDHRSDIGLVMSDLVDHRCLTLYSAVCLLPDWAELG